MTTMRDLLQKARDVYNNMEQSRWFNAIRSTKISLFDDLLKLNDSDLPKQILNLELHKDIRDGSRLKSIVNLLCFCVRVEKQEEPLTPTQENLFTNLRSNYLENFKYVTDYLNFYIIIDTFKNEQKTKLLEKANHLLSGQVSGLQDSAAEQESKHANESEKLDQLKTSLANVQLEKNKLAGQVSDLQQSLAVKEEKLKHESNNTVILRKHLASTKQDLLLAEEKAKQEKQHAREIAEKYEADRKKQQEKETEWPRLPSMPLNLFSQHATPTNSAAMVPGANTTLSSLLLSQKNTGIRYRK